MPEEPVKTAYEVLQVRPAAPAALLNTSYWLLIGDLQKRRERGDNVDARLHELTVAYQHVSDPEARAAYNAAMGITVEDFASAPTPKRKNSLPLRLLRAGQSVSTDYYEVLGLTPEAQSRLVDEAYRAMRDQYLRLRNAKRREAFLGLLDDAYAVIRDDKRRAEYDAERMVSAAATNAIPVKPADSKKNAPRAMTKAAAKAEADQVPVAAAVKRKAKDKPQAATPKREPKNVDPSPARAGGSTAAARWLGSLRPQDQKTKVGAKATPKVEPKATPKAETRQAAVVKPTAKQINPRRPKAAPRSAAKTIAEARPRHLFDKTEVEEVLLGRLAVSVKDAQRHLDGTAPEETTPPPEK